MNNKNISKLKIGVLMGSRSDWPIMKHSSDTLKALGIEHNCMVVSAHRSPDALFEFARNNTDYFAFIAGAGCAAHLPGVLAALTQVPVVGVPIKSDALSGQDSLYSIVQMPGGIPVATMAIGKAGAKNAALMVAAFMARVDQKTADVLTAFRKAQSVGIEAIE